MSSPRPGGMTAGAPRHAAATPEREAEVSPARLRRWRPRWPAAWRSARPEARLPLILLAGLTVIALGPIVVNDRAATWLLQHDAAFDKLKIDRSFVAGMRTAPKAAAIVATIVALAAPWG